MPTGPLPTHHDHQPCQAPESPSTNHESTQLPLQRPVGRSEGEPVVTPAELRGGTSRCGAGQTSPGGDPCPLWETEARKVWGVVRPLQVLSQTGLKAKQHSPHSKGAYGLGGGSAQAHYPRRREPVEGRQPHAGKAMPRGPQPTTLPGPSLVSLQELGAPVLMIMPSFIQRTSWPRQHVGTRCGLGTCRALSQSVGAVASHQQRGVLHCRKVVPSRHVEGEQNGGTAYKTGRSPGPQQWGEGGLGKGLGATGMEADESPLGSGHLSRCLPDSVLGKGPLW